MLCNRLPISVTADVFCRIMHGFVLLLHIFGFPLLKFFLTSFSTVGHLLTLVHLGQFAAPFVGVVSSVATVQPWAVMCVGGTSWTRHFTDIIRDRNQGCVAEGCILFYLGKMHVLPFYIRTIPNFLHRHKPKTAGKVMLGGGSEHVNIPLEVCADMAMSQSAYFCGLQKTTCI
jgi:hypothetical protein